MTNNRFSLKNKIILLTGASGKLAKVFIKDFLYNDAHVIGIDIKEKSPDLEIIDNHLQEKFTYYKADISNKSDL